MLIIIWFGNDIWDDGWAFGIWFTGSVVGGIGTWCCSIGVKNEDIWGTGIVSPFAGVLSLIHI